MGREMIWNWFRAGEVDMNTKRIVLWGLVITALIASLTISVSVPDYIIAMWIVLMGMGLTYYFALNRKRLDYIQKQGVLLEAAAHLTPGLGAREILAWGRQLAAKLVPCQAVFVWTSQEGSNEIPPFSWEGWGIIGNGIKDGQTRIYSTDVQPEGVSLPDTIHSLVVLPLHKEGVATGVLYLINRQGEKTFTPRDQRLILLLHKQICLALQNCYSLYQERAFYRRLIETVIDAAEITENIGHARRVSAIALLIGQKLVLEPEEMKVLEYSALLHDIGYAGGVQADSVEEIDHASAGAAKIQGEGIWNNIREAVRAHHERYDGSGFPQGLLRNDIPFPARIIAVADLYDALTHLAGEDCLSHIQALQAIKKATGTYFDPLVVVAFEEVEDIVAAGDNKLEQN